MSTVKRVSLCGTFTDVSGKEHAEIQAIHGQVFFNADDPDYVHVTVVGDNGVETNYTAPHSDVLNGGLISAGASYRSFDIVG